MDISCQFATSLRSAEHIARAEAMGYRRAWLFDTPAQSPDVWAMLALAAQQTRRIGLGPGVLVPTLRHPMVNASGAAMLSALAPGRVAVAFGTGFNGTRALGAPPATWTYLKSYVHTFRALLRGETVEWDRRPIRMLHPADHAPARPIQLPVLVSALGPKGLAIAREIADGLFSVNNQTNHAREFLWATLGIHGTVLEDNEPLDSARVRAAAGPGLALAYHATYEFGGDVTQLPGGQHWLKVINAQPEHERHLAVHDQHLVGLNQADEAAWAAGSWLAITTTTVTGSPARIAEQLAHYADHGITEIIYQPAGPDITGELERFMTVAHQTTQTVQSPGVIMTEHSNLDIHPPVALVTGATSGIGRAVALKLAGDGFDVIVHGRDAARGAATVAAIEEAGGYARFLAADLANPDEVARLADQAGEVDVLINNAGFSWFGPTAELDIDTFDALFASNVRSTYQLVAALVPGMAKRGSGSIISLDSMAGHVGLAGGAAYGATKAALSTLTRSWAAEFSPAGVRVNTVAPGPVFTEGADPDRVAQLGDTTLLHRAAQPEEIAEVIAFLASPKASYITGAMIPVDGGRTVV